MSASRPLLEAVTETVGPWIRSGLGPLRWGGTALVVFALLLATWSLLAKKSGFFPRNWERYVASLDRRLRALYMQGSGRDIAHTQLAISVGVLTAWVLFAIPFGWVAVAIVAIAPVFYLESSRRTRLAEIEDQLDTMLVALSNALKSTPSIGAAFVSIIPVVPNPIRQEVELATKEMKVGASLDQALIQMAARVGSRQLDSALSSVLIGRQVGGNLPRVLETTASTLREMKRLDGLIRTKTAEGRMQMWVIGALPAVFIMFFSYAFPGYFNPLTESTFGYVLIVAMSSAWVGSLIWARHVLAVDF